MATIAEYVKPRNEVARQFGDSEWFRQPQGPEGKQLLKKSEEAFLHWDERAEPLFAEPDFFISGCSREDDDAWVYVPIRPNRVYYVETYYDYVGKGLPRSFDWGDD